MSSPAERAKDTLGRVYEYFLSRFASAEGKSGGQFYTPSSVVRVLVEMPCYANTMALKWHVSELAADERIAMLITDIQMPIMDGFELAERAREKRPDMPIVLMSGKVVGRPGFPVIKKPFTQPQLAEIVGPIIRP